jgi:cyclopropane fatty-acyl-phospholipid synthase-like methyltransferase
MRDTTIQALIAGKQATFLSSTNFDASPLGRKFDIVFSHSVLSHAAGWQLRQYLSNAKWMLAPGGLMLASLALAEGNRWGNPGSPNRRDTNAAEWVYPGASFFTMETIQRTAAELGLSATYVPEYTAFYVKTRPNQQHDWFVFREDSATHTE